jgi:hypothetical protein
MIGREQLAATKQDVWQEKELLGRRGSEQLFTKRRRYEISKRPLKEEAS